MSFVLDYYWEIFIIAEILSVVSLVLFCLFRYFFNRTKQSIFFIIAFLVLLIFEVFLGLFVYKQTGEISTFLIVVTIFVLYACTFGIFDFVRLDRWMRKKIGEYRGVELLTEKDYDVLRKNQDPKHIARKYRLTASIHLVVFVIGQAIFWMQGTANVSEAISYLSDLSWINEGVVEQSPYPNETTYYIGMIWGIVFAVDFIYSWSYTVFPSEK